MFYIALPCLPWYIEFQQLLLHYGDNAKVKTWHICRAIPNPAQGLGGGGGMVTNDWCISIQRVKGMSYKQWNGHEQTMVHLDIPSSVYTNHPKFTVSNQMEGVHKPTKGYRFELQTMEWPWTNNGTSGYSFFSVYKPSQVYYIKPDGSIHKVTKGRPLD